MPAPQPITTAPIFISYSHRDVRWLKRLQVHLKPLEREGLLALWDDTRLSAGSHWRDEIRDAIASARAAVLLVSADFLASDFIATDELPPLLHAAQQRGVRILPLIVSPSLFEQIPSLARFQSINPPSAPLNKLTKAKQEGFLLDLATKLQQLVAAATPRADRSPDTPTPAAFTRSDASLAPDAASAAGSKTDLLDRLAQCSGMEFVSLILGDAVSLESLNHALARSPAATSAALQHLARRIDDASADTWVRLLCAYLCSRAPQLMEDALTLAFEGDRRWGTRTTAVSWLRFCPRDQRRAVAGRLYSIGEGDDVDSTRLCVAGVGFLGESTTISGLLSLFDALSDGYYNDKLGSYGCFSYLDCFVHHGREWQPFHLLDAMSTVYDATARAGNMQRMPGHFFHRLQTLAAGPRHCALDHLWDHQLEPLLQGLLRNLSNRPSAIMVGRLRRMIQRARPKDHPNEALTALARIRSPNTVEIVSELTKRRGNQHDVARLLAIGTNRSERDLDVVLAARLSGGEIGNTAYWAMGELARSADSALVAPLRDAALEDENGWHRALAWLGLAKAGVKVPARDLEDAVDAAATYEEVVVLGIAGALLGHRSVFERGLNASESNNEPVWSMPGHLYADWLAAVEIGAGAPGHMLLGLLRCGDLAA